MLFLLQSVLVSRPSAKTPADRRILNTAPNSPIKIDINAAHERAPKFEQLFDICHGAFWKLNVDVGSILLNYEPTMVASLLCFLKDMPVAEPLVALLQNKQAELAKMARQREQEEKGGSSSFQGLFGSIGAGTASEGLGTTTSAGETVSVDGTVASVLLPTPERAESFRSPPLGPGAIGDSRRDQTSFREDSLSGSVVESVGAGASFGGVSGKKAVDIMLDSLDTKELLMPTPANPNPTGAWPVGTLKYKLIFKADAIKIRWLETIQDDTRNQPVKQYTFADSLIERLNFDLFLYEERVIFDAVFGNFCLRDLSNPRKPLMLGMKKTGERGKSPSAVERAVGRGRGAGNNVHPEEDSPRTLKKVKDVESSEQKQPFLKLFVKTLTPSDQTLDTPLDIAYIIDLDFLNPEMIFIKDKFLRCWRWITYYFVTSITVGPDPREEPDELKVEAGFVNPLPFGAAGVRASKDSAASSPPGLSDPSNALSSPTGGPCSPGGPDDDSLLGTTAGAPPSNSGSRALGGVAASKEDDPMLHHMPRSYRLNVKVKNPSVFAPASTDGSGDLLELWTHESLTVVNRAVYVPEATGLNQSGSKFFYDPNRNLYAEEGFEFPSGDPACVLRAGYEDGSLSQQEVDLATSGDESEIARLLKGVYNSRHPFLTLQVLTRDQKRRVPPVPTRKMLNHFGWHDRILIQGSSVQLTKRGWTGGVLNAGVPMLEEPLDVEVEFIRQIEDYKRCGYVNEWFSAGNGSPDFNGRTHFSSGPDDRGPGAAAGAAAPPTIQDKCLFEYWPWSYKIRVNISTITVKMTESEWEFLKGVFFKNLNALDLDVVVRENRFLRDIIDVRMGWAYRNWIEVLVNLQTVNLVFLLDGNLPPDLLGEPEDAGGGGAGGQLSGTQLNAKLNKLVHRGLDEGDNGANPTHWQFEGDRGKGQMGEETPS